MQIAKKLEEYAARMKSGEVTVGFLEDATYPDGTPVAAVAFWNEYGHGGTFPAPARPFFRPMIANESPSWGPKMVALAKRGASSEEILNIMGEDISGALKQSIATAGVEPLSATTLILRKVYGNDPSDIRKRDVLAAQELVNEGQKGATGTQAKPLVWTGVLISSPDYEVKS